jgi:hypothetical protein
MAHHGRIGEEEKSELHGLDGSSQRVDENESRCSSITRFASHKMPRNEVSDINIDPGKGKDVTVDLGFQKMIQRSTP